MKFPPNRNKKSKKDKMKLKETFFSLFVLGKRFMDFRVQ